MIARNVRNLHSANTAAAMMRHVHPVGTAAVTENLLKRKWSSIILRHLSNGLTDPTAICKLEPDLSSAVTNERLRAMLRYGLITRNPRHSATKTVEYRLTPRGQKILQMVTLIEQLDDLHDKSEIVIEEAISEVTPPAVRTQDTSRGKDAPARKWAPDSRPETPSSSPHALPDDLEQ